MRKVWIGRRWKKGMKTRASPRAPCEKRARKDQVGWNALPEVCSVGQGTVPCPTKKTTIESHSHGARSQSLPAPWINTFSPITFLVLSAFMCLPFRFVFHIPSNFLYNFCYGGFVFFGFCCFRKSANKSCEYWFRPYSRQTQDARNQTHLSRIEAKKKVPKTLVIEQSSELFWCARRDLNPHARSEH